MSSTKDIIDFYDIDVVPFDIREVNGELSKTGLSISMAKNMLIPESGRVTYCDISLDVKKRKMEIEFPDVYVYPPLDEFLGMIIRILFTHKDAYSKDMYRNVIDFVNERKLLSIKMAQRGKYQLLKNKLEDDGSYDDDDPDTHF